MAREVIPRTNPATAGGQGKEAVVAVSEHGRKPGRIPTAPDDEEWRAGLRHVPWQFGQAVVRGTTMPRAERSQSRRTNGHALRGTRPHENRGPRSAGLSRRTNPKLRALGGMGGDQGGSFKGSHRAER